MAITEDADSTVQYVYTFINVGIFIFLSLRMLLLAVGVFTGLSLLILLGKALFHVMERYGTTFAVIYISVAIFLAGYAIWFVQSQTLRCEKCGYPLDDRHLYDEDTVSMFRCPKCEHITHLKWE